MATEPIRCEYSEYLDVFRWWKAERKRPTGKDLKGVPLAEPKLFYNTLADLAMESIRKGIKEAPGSNERASYNQSLEELKWYQSGKPYYKISPGIFNDLLETNIDIDCALFKMPHSIFEIKFPKGALRETADSPSINGLLVNLREKGTFLNLSGNPAFVPDYGRSIDIEDDMLIVRMDVGIEEVQTPSGEKVKSPASCFLQFRLLPGKTIEYCFDNRPPNQPDIQGYFPGEEFSRKILQLACAVALLASYNSDMLHPDLSRKLFARYYEAKKRNNLQSLAEIEDKRIKLGMAKGWIIGLETDEQPQPVYVEPGEGHELHYRHFRRPHLRLQPTGPRTQPVYVIRFVRPTIVRPDLPSKPTS